MTRVEVERECDKAGWTLRQHAALVRELRGLTRVEWWSVTANDGRSLACLDSPREAYLEACRREGRSPF